MTHDAEHQFDRLWRDHAAAVLRYAHRRVPPSEVDDVVAETFVVAWRRLAEVPEHPLPWLLGVARGVSANVARSSRRREALERQVVSRRTLGVVPDIADGVADRQPDAVHLAALERLSTGDRELLTLLAWDDLSHDEAAQVMGCSRGALRVRLHRARRRFRVLLTTAAAASVSGAACPARLATATLPTRTERTGGAA